MIKSQSHLSYYTFKKLVDLKYSIIHVNYIMNIIKQRNINCLLTSLQYSNSLEMIKLQLQLEIDWVNNNINDQQLKEQTFKNSSIYQRILTEEDDIYTIFSKQVGDSILIPKIAPSWVLQNMEFMKPKKVK